MNPRPFVCPACAGTEQGYALRCADCFPARPFLAKALQRQRGAIEQALRRAVNLIATK